MDNKTVSKKIKEILGSLKFEYPNEEVKLDGMIKYISNIEEEKQLQDECSFCRTQEYIEGEDDSRSKFFINNTHELCFEGIVDIYDDIYKNNISSYENKEDYIKIEYCPKCGRKLL
jgi:hypothetical protein